MPEKGLRVALSRSPQRPHFLLGEQVERHALVVWDDERDYATRWTDIYGQRLAGQAAQPPAPFRVAAPEPPPPT